MVGWMDGWMDTRILKTYMGLVKVWQSNFWVTFVMSVTSCHPSIWPLSVSWSQNTAPHLRWIGNWVLFEDKSWFLFGANPTATKRWCIPGNLPNGVPDLPEFLSIGVQSDNCQKRHGRWKSWRAHCTEFCRKNWIEPWVEIGCTHRPSQSVILSSNENLGVRYVTSLVTMGLLFGGDRWGLVGGRLLPSCHGGSTVKSLLASSPPTDGHGPTPGPAPHSHLGAFLPFRIILFLWE